MKLEPKKAEKWKNQPEALINKETSSSKKAAWINFQSTTQF